MTRARKWLLAAGIAMGVLLLGLALVRLVPSDEALAKRASAELEAALGVPVSVGALHWRLLPSVVVVMEGMATRQAQPIVVKKLTANINLAALLRRRLKVDSVEVAGAVVPQLSLRGLQGQPDLGTPGTPGAGEVALAQLVFRDVSWISRYGKRVVFEGEVTFDPGWRPRKAGLRRPDFQPAADLTLTRQGLDDRWDASIKLGGGTAHGELQLQTRADGRLHLGGKLQPRGIEVANALAAFNRRSVISGKASGETSLSASGATVAELARSLHTTTPFTIGRSTLLSLDLDRAIRSAGKEHAGKTPLESVSGQLDTQNTPDGMVVEFTRVQAASGALSAAGKARIANQQIEAEFAVDLVAGWVGVPLRLSGPLDHVTVSVPPGAIAGAVLGTAVLPGAGTAIGARLGAALGKIFGHGPPAQRKAKPPASDGNRH